MKPIFQPFFPITTTATTTDETIAVTTVVSTTTTTVATTTTEAHQTTIEIATTTVDLTTITTIITRTTETTTESNLGKIPPLTPGTIKDKSILEINTFKIVRQKTLLIPGVLLLRLIIRPIVFGNLVDQQIRILELVLVLIKLVLLPLTIIKMLTTVKVAIPLINWLIIWKIQI